MWVFEQLNLISKKPYKQIEPRKTMFREKLAIFKK